MKYFLITLTVFFGVLSAPSHAARIEAKVDISQQKMRFFIVATLQFMARTKLNVLVVQHLLVVSEFILQMQPSFLVWFKDTVKEISV